MTIHTDVWGKKFHIPDPPACAPGTNTSLSFAECPQCKSKLCPRQLFIEQEKEAYAEAWTIRQLGA